MNIINKLTLKHLMKNKKQTLVTIIGVIISVAMVTAVITLGSSFLVLMQKETIKDYGDWHVLYRDVNKEQLEAIKQDTETKQFMTSKERGYAWLPGSQNFNKPYLFMKAYNAQGFTNFPIELSKGRFPERADEIVLSEAIATNAKVAYRIGDHLTLEVGQRYNQTDPSDTDLTQNDQLRSSAGESVETLIHTTTETYTVVGFIKRPTWEQTWAPGYTALTYVDEHMLDATNKTVDVSVVVKNIDSTVFDHANDLAEKNNISSFKTNDSLLRYYGVMGGGLGKTYNSLFLIVVLVIVVGSISLIYNAFAISVSERSRYLGMLSSVGATRRQKRNSVFFEGAVIGGISIPLGVICGMLGIGITFRFINPILEDALGVTEKLTLVVTPLSIALACLVSIITIFISTYVPAQRASKISAIDAIRQTADIKLTSKALKTSKLVKRLFGVEAEIGLKNLKRNKRRYYATVFSLVISVVLFLAVSFFTSNLQKSLELSQKGYNYDIAIYTIGRGATLEDEQSVKTITSLENVTEFNLMKQMNGAYMWLAEEVVPENIKPHLYQERNLYKYNIRVNSMKEDKLKVYAKQVGVEYAKLTNLDHPTAILIDTMTFLDEKGKFIETKVNGKVGEMLDLVSEDDKQQVVNKVELAAVTDNFPMGIVQTDSILQVNLVVSEPVFDQLMKKSVFVSSYSGLYLKSNEPLKTQQDIEEMQKDVTVMNLFQERQRSERKILFMSVFVYGFVALITAVSITNIFNTISTSVALRKREFAMLRSVGMTPKSFHKMINYESIFYGIKSLAYGLPISAVIMVLIYRSFMYSFSYEFVLPWASIMYVIAAVFVIVSLSMYYASIKVKKANIIDALKQENL
ncbi:FtsX-like permease family protein [Brevibacillus ruminantium]|uniref:FtsX-like permease family protein n=1 Tax=Brevibacillus ruminantium TaxID=2950604 RepID=A0ABY4WM83_9BACL|nr:FtsX-like permease family protein [Brevibacillus ruminantium]USG68278.1 FtsX-like permease family protein [Brevibacillus ruminantium]